MKVVTPSQMNEIDKFVMESAGIPGILLMENAGLSVVREVEKTLGRLQDKRVIIFAGKGNNGGDAFVAARHLYNCGAKVAVYITAEKHTIKGDTLVNLNIIEKMDIVIVELLKRSQRGKLKQELLLADIIVDGIFGTGIKDEVKGLQADIIEIINEIPHTIKSIKNI